MQSLTEPTVNKRSLFFWLILLTGFFILLEISFYIQCNQHYLSGFAEVSQQLKIPYTIIPGILFFVVVQLLLHLIFTFYVWLISIGLIKFFNRKTDEINIGITVWLLVLFCCLLANQIYIPNSKFSDLLHYLFPTLTIARVFYFIVLGINLTLFTFAMLGFRNYLTNKYVLALALTIATVIIIEKKIEISPRPVQFQSIHKNVVIVGIDSLRPDFLGFFGAAIETPNLDALLGQAAVFSDAVTPLARTFPSWVSILTGSPPYVHGVRSNLTSQEHLDLTQSLPRLFQKAGYRTIYATDETRFSNINKNFGFDELVVPPMGLNDFLIGSSNDFPFSNLIVNTALGKWLFPYSYANRAVFFTYDPNSFLGRIETSMQQNVNKPLFLVVHFCLAHFPYIWIKANPAEDVTERYALSVQGVDQQIGDFFALLNANGVLKNALVVILSDHGEAIEFNGDRVTEKALYTETHEPKRFYPPSLDMEDFNQSAGHGTDVLGIPQYHSLLAFLDFGRSSPHVISGAVSLTQIKPTILDILFQQASARSLKKYIDHPTEGVADQHILLESDFSPESIRTIYPDIRKAILEGIQLFEIKAGTLQLVLKKDMEARVIASKQYADLYGDWLLALYPTSAKFSHPILINLHTGVWTDNLTSTFAKTAPIAAMLKNLQNAYGHEIKPIAQEYSHATREARITQKTPQYTKI